MTPAHLAGSRLYAATTVAPPTRVASTKTLPPRSSLMNALVTVSGSSSSARALIARRGGGRVAPACDVALDGHEQMQSFAPLVLSAAVRPRSSEHLAHDPRRTHRLGRCRCARRSMSSTRWVIRSGLSMRTSAGWIDSIAGSRTRAACGDRCRAHRSRHVSDDPPAASPRYPWRREEEILLHERFMTAVECGSPTGAVLQDRNDPIGHTVEVLDRDPAWSRLRRQTGDRRDW